MADAPDLGSGVYDVGVQVPSSALVRFTIAANYDKLSLNYPQSQT